MRHSSKALWGLLLQYKVTGLLLTPWGGVSWSINGMGVKADQWVGLEGCEPALPVHSTAFKKGLRVNSQVLEILFSNVQWRVHHVQTEMNPTDYTEKCKLHNTGFLPLKKNIYLAMLAFSCSTQDLGFSLWPIRSLVVVCELSVTAWGISSLDQRLNLDLLCWELRVT